MECPSVFYSRSSSDDFPNFNFGTSYSHVSPTKFCMGAFFFPIILKIHMFISFLNFSMLIVPPQYASLC